MEREQRLRTYLGRINPVIERLIIDLLVDTPEDFISFSVNWLQDKGRKISQGEDVTTPFRTINSALKQTSKAKQQEEAHHNHHNKHNHHGSDSSSDDDEVDDTIEESIIAAQKKNGMKTRSSVSAEVYGIFNKKESYVPKVIQKEAEQKKRIETRLMQAFMFSALDDREREIVVGAMAEVKFEKDDWIIKQGEDGEVLYVVDQGQLDCFKRFSKGADNTYLKTYKPGESFGELALLYNAPRAASIQAKTDAVLFSLDRECFNHIVKDSASKKRERFEQTLQKVELLQSMDPYERVQLCDGIKDVKYSKGEYVIKQGEVGNNFYMIEEGHLKATKKNSSGEEITVFEYKEGDYFGELALVKNIPRQANVVATTDVRLMYLDHDTFKRLLGPIEGILQRNEARYEKFASDNLL